MGAMNTFSEQEWDFGPRPMNPFQIVGFIFAAIFVINAVVTGEPVFLVFALLLGFGSLASMGSRLRVARGKVKVSHEGVSLIRRMDTLILRWEDIDHFFLDVKTLRGASGKEIALIYGISLAARDGRHATIPPTFPNGFPILRAILPHVTPRMKAAAVRAFFAPEAKALEFGPVAISQTGLRISKTFRSWEEIDSLTVQRAALGDEFQLSGSRGVWTDCGTCKLNEIPNAPILFDIIRLHADFHAEEGLAKLLEGIP